MIGTLLGGDVFKGRKVWREGSGFDVFTKFRKWESVKRYQLRGTIILQGTERR